MKLNPDIHKRKSIRLKDYDYSQEWLYFITISVKDKLCLFWEIKNDEMLLFDSGKMIGEYWWELENKFDNVKLHGFVVMPNHFHGVVEIQNVGADLCVRPDNVDDNICHDIGNGNDNVDIRENVLLNKSGWTHRFTPTGGQFLYNQQWISSIMQWFKTMTTNSYIQNVNKNNWLSFNKKLWQRNFHEHIIRDENSYNTIIDYINNNPLKWNEDKFYYTEI